MTICAYQHFAKSPHRGWRKSAGNPSWWTPVENMCQRCRFQLDSTWISCLSQCLCTKTAHTCSANELFPKWRNVGVWSKSLEATADKFQNNDACVLPNGTSHLCNEDLGKVPRQNCFRSCQSLKNMKQNKPLKQLLATTHFSVFLVNGTRNSEAFAKWPSALQVGLGHLQLHLDTLCQGQSICLTPHDFTAAYGCNQNQ